MTFVVDWFDKTPVMNATRQIDVDWSWPKFPRPIDKNLGEHLISKKKDQKKKFKTKMNQRLTKKINVTK